MVKKMAEESKVAVRNIRRESNDQLKAMEKGKEISKDDCHRATEQVQEITDGVIEKITGIIEDKEKEILED